MILKFLVKIVVRIPQLGVQNVIKILTVFMKTAFVKSAIQCNVKCIRIL